jgi:hypothetical protein
MSLLGHNAAAGLTTLEDEDTSASKNRKDFIGLLKVIVKGSPQS